MHRVCASTLTAFALAAGVRAQNLTLSVKFSSDGGVTWASQLVGNLGSVFQAGIFMSGENIYGLGGATLRLTESGEQGDFANFGAGTETGRVGPFDFGAATNAIYATAGGFRIDAASDPDNANTAAGMTFFQRDPSSGAATFSTANPALCFRFDIHTVSVPGGRRNITVELDQLSRGVATYYSSSTSTRPTSATVTLNSGSVVFLPTPSVLGIACLGASFAVRRRRST